MQPSRKTQPDNRMYQQFAKSSSLKSIFQKVSKNINQIIFLPNSNVDLEGRSFDLNSRAEI